MNFQNSAHSGAYGELCSASEQVSYFSTGDNPGSISTDGRRQKNRGSSNDEHLTWDGLINDEPVDPISAHFQNVLQPEDQLILTACIPAKKWDINKDWVSVSREVLQFLHSEGIVGISVDICDSWASKPDACFLIVEGDAIFSIWDKVLDAILDTCDTQDWNSIGCYHIRKEEKNYLQNPATVLVTVDKTASSCDWRPSQEAVVAILDAFKLPMVMVKIVGTDIVCTASLMPTEFPNAKDLLESTVWVGKSVGRCQYEGECGTFGGWIELLDSETEQWCVFGLTCSHVALPDNANVYTDSNDPHPQMDSPSQQDLDSRLLSLDKWFNSLMNDTIYIESNGSVTSMDWALIDAPEQYKMNKVSSMQIKKIQS